MNVTRQRIARCDALLPGSRRRGRWPAPFEMAKRDAALAQIVGRQLQRHVVAGQDTDVMLAHLARGVGNVLGLVLGDIVDKSLRRGLVLSDGSLLPFFTRPISAVLALLVLVMLVAQVPALRRLVGFRKP